MAFKRYDPKTKDLIMKTAAAERGAGKSWAEAHAAARAVGYKGSPEGLDVMIRNANQKTAKAKPAEKPSPQAAKPATGKPGIAMRYDPKTKAAITAAAASARSKGKTWEGAHAAAKEAGYKGSVQGLIKMIGAAKKKSQKAKSGAKAAPISIAKAAVKPSSPANSAAAEGYDPVHAMIDQIVKQKVKAVVEKAIAELKKAVE